jgi:hypothetical protein
MGRGKMKDFSGYIIWSASSVMTNYNGKKVVKTIRKAIPNDDDSTLWIVKVSGVKGYLEVYEDEMYK